jgi:hypothetical protein
MEIGDVIRMISIYGGGAVVLAVLGVIFLPKIFGKKKRSSIVGNLTDSADPEELELDRVLKKVRKEKVIRFNQKESAEDWRAAAEAENVAIGLEMGNLPRKITIAEENRQIAKLKKEETSLNRPLFVKAMMVAAPAAIVLLIFVGLCFFAKANGWN